MCIRDRPKTYGIRSENGDTIKLKGYGNKGISFDVLKDSFYDNQYIEQAEYRISRKNFIMAHSWYTKKSFLNSYVKRAFSYDKKTSSAFVLEPSNLDDTNI
jgi:hypothetical protein